MKLSPSAAKKLGIDGGHGATVKADTTHGRILCEGVIQEVYALTKGKVMGTTEVYFHPERRWRFDAAFQHKGKKIALELNGWTSHHRRGRIREDNVKHFAAVELGWTVLYVDTDQVKRVAALWVVRLLDPLSRSVWETKRKGDEAQW